jgi:hypothetical protein
MLSVTRLIWAAKIARARGLNEGNGVVPLKSRPLGIFRICRRLVAMLIVKRMILFSHWSTTFPHARFPTVRR